MINIVCVLRYCPINDSYALDKGGITHLIYRLLRLMIVVVIPYITAGQLKQDWSDPVALVRSSWDM